MPAAGKSRKGVFRMKKLLLVMLVPVLVLGIMGCGSSLETGSELPYILHGTWINNDADLDTDAVALAPWFVFSANEMTIYLPTAAAALAIADGDDINFADMFLQLAFRAEFGGNTDNFLTANDNANVQRFTVGITRILDGVEFGTFTLNYNKSDDTINVNLTDPVGSIRIDTSVVPYYEFQDLLAAGTTYGRAVAIAE
jgi:hypothetical protein